MRQTMTLRLVPASDYMIETYFYESRNAIPHLKLQQWWEYDFEPDEHGEARNGGEWRDVQIEEKP